MVDHPQPQDLRSVSENRPPPSGTTSVNRTDDSAIEVHTMPERFLEGGVKTGIRPNHFLMIGGTVVLLLTLGVVTAFLFKRLMKDEVAVPSVNLVERAPQALNEALNVNTSPINTNANSNVNGPTNENQNVAVSNLNENANLNVNRTPKTGIPLPSGRDTDGDGLTDKEEETFGLDSKKPDSDSDGYTDGVEIESGYDPLGKGLLSDSTVIKKYTNPTYSYTIFYPQSWLVQAVNKDNDEVLFTADTAEFVEVLVADNPSRLTVDKWFLSQFPTLKENEISHVTTWKKETGVRSIDGNTIYFALEDNIDLVTYNTGTREEANFQKTFEMMAKSIDFLPRSGMMTNTNTGVDANVNQNTNSVILKNNNLNAR